MDPKRGGAWALARHDELRKWCGLETNADAIGGRSRTDGNARGTTTEARGSTHVASTEFVSNNSDRGGISGRIVRHESASSTKYDGGNGYESGRNDDRYAQGNDRNTRHPWEHDVSWTDGTSHRRHDVGRLEVGHDKLARSYELVANSFIVRKAEP
jgi:hypothetical protein